MCPSATAGYFRLLGAMCRVTRRVDLLENATPYINSAKEPFPADVCHKS